MCKASGLSSTAISNALRKNRTQLGPSSSLDKSQLTAFFSLFQEVKLSFILCVYTQNAQISMENPYLHAKHEEKGGSPQPPLAIQLCISHWQGTKSPLHPGPLSLTPPTVPGMDITWIDLFWCGWVGGWVGDSEGPEKTE